MNCKTSVIVTDLIPPCAVYIESTLPPKMMPQLALIFSTDSQIIPKMEEIHTQQRGNNAKTKNAC